MKQREVTDSDGTIWACVQAFTGINGDAATRAAQLSESPQGTVQVVCTPRGGQQTVRLELPADWEEQLSDEALVQAILEARSPGTDANA